MVRFTEVYLRPGTNNYSMREIVVNPQHVVAFREDSEARSALHENRMPSGLSEDVSFTRIYLNSGSGELNVIVAGGPAIVESKLNNSRRLLKG